jgi:hypothetical protein
MAPAPQQQMMQTKLADMKALNISKKCINYDASKIASKDITKFWEPA